MEHLIDVQPVILAAGKGTRMGLEVPKVLFTINGQPMILYILEQLKKFPAMKPPVIVVGFRYDLIQGRLGHDYKYAFQQGQLGTGHAVAAAKRQADGRHILILNGDMPFIKASTLDKFIKKHKDNSAIFSMMTTEVPNFDAEYSSFNGLGRVIRKGRKVEKIVEFIDASPEEKQIKEVNPGVYLIEANWLWENLDKIEPNNKQKEYYLTDIVAIASRKKVSIKTFSASPWEVFGINNKQQLKQAEEMSNLI